MFEMLSRRHLLVSAAGLGVAACSTNLRSTSPFWSTVTNNRPQKADSDIRTYADALPYPSMLFWFDGQARSLIVLGKDGADEHRTWYTAEKQAITTFGPFIIAAIGTEIELRQTTFSDGWSSDVRRLVGKSLSRQTLVARRGEEATATLASRFSDAGKTMIDVLGTEVPAQRIDESVVADDRVRMLNSYWVDPANGNWLKTRQQVIPMMPPTNTIMLKAS
jgi:Group 4 capsule polysaccharide lipoprotein gfcB, YjbF